MIEADRLGGKLKYGSGAAEPDVDAAVELDVDRDASLEQKMRPEVRARRARFTRYVGWTVGGLAVFCAIAFVRDSTADRSAPIARAEAAATPTPSAAPEKAIAPQIAETPPVKTAADEKQDARAALDRGALASAIDAAERSVALDATDAEAWLILGKAFQKSGKRTEARRAFAACVKKGKRGPLRECARL